MAELNFPKDRTELDPPGSGALQTGDEYKANGTTWIYDSVAGAWGSGGTGDSLSDLYLSKVIADTAADVISFDAGAQLKNLTNAPALATDADGTIIASDTFAKDEADALYLSKTKDDTAAGAITFKELSTVEKGLFIGPEKLSRLDAASNVFRFSTGGIPGGSWTPLTIARTHDSTKAISVRNDSPKDGSTKTYHGGISTTVGIEGITATGGNSNSNNIPCCYTSSLYFDTASSCTTFAHYNVGTSKNVNNDGTGRAPNTLYGYLCSAAAFGMNDGTTNTAFGSTTISAFNTNLNSNTAGANEVFAIECTGDAQSFFGGPVNIDANTTSRKYIADSTYRTTGGGSYGYTCAITHILDGGTNSNNVYPTSFKSNPKVQTNSISNLSHFLAQGMGFEGNGSVVNQRVFDCSVNMTDTATTTYGFIARLNTGSKTNWNFYATGTAPSKIPNLDTTRISLLAISELEQVDDEGNPILWEQPTAATVGTGIYRNEAGALCFARDGECALEIGNGQVIGNLLDTLNSIEARLAALEGA